MKEGYWSCCGLFIVYHELWTVRRSLQKVLGHQAAAAANVPCCESSRAAWRRIPRSRVYASERGQCRKGCRAGGPREGRPGGGRGRVGGPPGQERCAAIAPPAEPHPGTVALPPVTSQQPPHERYLNLLLPGRGTRTSHFAANTSRVNLSGGGFVNVGALQ